MDRRSFHYQLSHGYPLFSAEFSSGSGFDANSVVTRLPLHPAITSLSIRMENRNKNKFEQESIRGLTCVNDPVPTPSHRCTTSYFWPDN